MVNRQALPVGPSLLVEVALPVPLPQTFTYLFESAAPSGEREPRPGDLALVDFGRRQQMVGLVVAVAADEPARRPPGRQLRRIRRLLPESYRLEGARLRLAHWLADYHALPLGEVVPLFHPPAPGTRSRPARKREAGYPLADPDGIELTAGQQEAADLARGLLAAGRYGAVLLHGVTGSGKTEVYLRVIAEALAQGKGALYLLPEIALTPQTVARITERFPGLVAQLHSGLAVGERCRVHEAAAAGEIRVVVGPRSALFAPVRNLGVIVIDEEHETSYKQEEKPRYHARHAALVLARESGCVALLGSATPDLESFRNGLAGRYRMVRLPERVLGALPEVAIVDLRSQPAPDGLTPRLQGEISRTLAAGQQVLLYYNRRGFARALQCQACGEPVTCPRCDIGLTYHLRPHRLLCHYCGHRRPVPDTCGSCGAVDAYLTTGGGTEKIELALAAAHPGVPILRLDQDATRRRGSHARILADFAAGRARILVGTQMVAKGHHFPNVGLVGVLAADDGLSLPDYRAAEKVFQLLTQVAGRTGRIRPGRVIFQTFRPADPIILAAARHDYEAFAAAELPARQAFGYPPFRRLLRIGLSGRRQGATGSAAQALAAGIHQGLAGGDLEILGPAPAVFPRLQDCYRYQLLVKGRLGKDQKAWLADCARALHNRERGLDVVLDFDPIGLF
jgi:primosomal protein N' (replication factor Y)